MVFVADDLGAPLAGPTAGRPVGRVRDPFALEVHRPVQPDYPQPGLPELPVYVPREHDAELAGVVRAAAEGRSGIAVLVGGSSTGKTRACWEALDLLRDRKPGWRLWHPIGPSRPDAVLRELPGVGPRTVAWLNEAQFYLDPPADVGLGERVAAGLGELLRDPARAPVLVLATLWPQFWGDLTARPARSGDPRAEARELLAGHDITVPAAFTAAQLQRLSQAGDARLVRAAAAQDGQVIQFLAGAPELLARYRDAPPVAKALIQAAMDARRLGMGPALPQAFLEAAAPGYLAGTGRDARGGDWLEQALAYLAVPCKGVRGPLTRILPSRTRSRGPGPRPPDSDERLAGGGQAGIPRVYRLADYLDQHGRADRKSQIPPASFWAAAAGHALPGEQAALGDAAHARELYRDAAQLHKNAAARGNLRAVSYLASTPPCLGADTRPVRWAVTHILFDDPDAVADLLDRLREAGASEQVTALLARDPAGHVPLDDPDAVASLLGALREAEAQEQVTALLARDPAAHVPVGDLYAVDHLLNELREAGAQEQAAVLAGRAAAHVPLDEPDAVAWLLSRLLEAGAQEQVTVLVRRDPAAHAPLGEAGAVAWLLDKLREAGAQEQVTVLVRRDPAAHAPLDDPEAVADLLYALRAAGALDQVSALLRRDPAAHVSLRDPGAVAWLLPSLRAAGAPEQATALAGRAAAHAPLDDPSAVAKLLGKLQEAGTQEQITALAGRAAAHAPLDDPSAVAKLLDSLREAGTQEQVTALAGRAAAHAPLDDPGAVADLLDRLQWAEAPEQVTALLARDPAAHVPLGDPGAIAWLLDRLRAAGAPEQVTALLARDPAAHVSLDDPGAVAWLLSRLRAAGAGEQATTLAGRAARYIPLDDREAVAALLDRLRAMGEREPATTLAERLPGAGMFEVFREQEEDRFRFGREADGSPAGPWDWEDLD